MIVATDSFLPEAIRTFSGGALWLKLSHVWSCEVEDWKRHFLPMAHGDHLQIYKDVMTLSEQTVPACDWFWAGFSCRSMSGLNKNRHNFVGT